MVEQSRPRSSEDGIAVEAPSSPSPSPRRPGRLRACGRRVGQRPSDRIWRGPRRRRRCRPSPPLLRPAAACPRARRRPRPLRNRARRARGGAPAHCRRSTPRCTTCSPGGPDGARRRRLQAPPACAGWCLQLPTPNCAQQGRGAAPARREAGRGRRRGRRERAAARGRRLGRVVQVRAEREPAVAAGGQVASPRSTRCACPASAPPRSPRPPASATATRWAPGAGPRGRRRGARRSSMRC